MAQEDVFKKLVSHCKEYGLYFRQVIFMTDWVLSMITVRWEWS